MTVATTDITSGPYTGNGVTAQFSYDFRVDDKSQLIIYETDNSGTPVVTELVVDVDYTVNNVGTNGGGTIDRIAGALPTGDEWYIRSDYDGVQQTNFSSQGGFFPAIHESAFDKLTFLHQQQTDLISRAVRLPDSYSGAADLQLPPPEGDKTIIWNPAGDGLVNGPTIGTFAGYAANAAASEAACAADLVQTNQDTLDTAADLVLTNADVVTTNADVVLTAADVVTTNQDTIDTAADVVTTNQDTIDTAADLAATNQDVIDAGIAKVAAEAAQAAAEATFDNFDDAYLGAKATAPTLDNDNNALQDGAMYFDTTLNAMRVYDLGNTTWISLPVTSLSAMTDVVLTSLTTGELIKWDGSDWINQTLAEAGIEPADGTILKDADIGGSVQAYDADTAKTDVQNDWTVQQVTPPVALTDATTIAWNLDTAPNATVTIAANRTLGLPTNIRAGNIVLISVKQDATGSRTLAYNAAFDFGAEGAPTLTTTASKFDVLSFFAVSTSKLRFMGIKQEFTS